jgi:hypothetical protein
MGQIEKALKNIDSSKDQKLDILPLDRKDSIETSQKTEIPSELQEIPDSDILPWERIETSQKTEIPSELQEIPDSDILPWKREDSIETSQKTEISSELQKIPDSDTLPWEREDLKDAIDDSQKENQKDSLKTRNADLKGKNHPETGVPYEEKTVKDADGKPIEGVFPVFDSVFDVQLPEDLYMETDAKQFKECNRQLKEAVEKDPKLAKEFTPEQLEQIKNGDTPDGYTWHHNEETGKMQLVDSETHAKTGHTGGKAIWGGGQEKR